MGNKLFALLVALAVVGPLRAQQASQYTQYVLNMFAINPAMAGSRECIDARLGVRRQWVDFEGAPTTGWATVHARLRTKGKPYRNHYHGLGMYMGSDQAGPLGSTVLQLAYAFHMKASRNGTLSMGFFAGVRQQRIDASRINTLLPGDPAVAFSGAQMLYPDVAPGIQYATSAFWLGLSIHNALGNDMGDIGLDARLARQTMLTAGHRIKIDKRLSVVPSTLIKFGPGVPMALDLNLMFEYQRTLGLGVSYRNQDAIAAMIKVPLLKYFTLGYSYDLTTSRLRAAGANTHELVLAIYPCPPVDPQKAIVRCPIFE